MLPEDVFHACALLRPSAEGEYQLSEAVRLLVRAGYDVATIRLGERVNVNTPDDVEQASELIKKIRRELIRRVAVDDRDSDRNVYDPVKSE